MAIVFKLRENSLRGLLMNWKKFNQTRLESLKMEIAVRLDMVENCQICYTLNVISGSFISEKGQI